MNLKEYLFSLNKNLKELVLQPFEHNNLILGYNAVLFDKDNYPYSGGTHELKEMAIRIAISEGIERALFEILRNNKNYGKFLALDEYPSTAGFAAGFDHKLTKKRSIYEAIERWAWSKWIDQRFLINKLNKDEIVLDQFSEKLLTHFDDVIFYQKQLVLRNSSHSTNGNLSFNVFLGLKGDGIFPGSRVCDNKDNGFNHSIVEAYRNLNNFLGNSLVENGDIIEKRIIYFGKNREKALSDIYLSKKLNWPNPELRFSSEISTGRDDVFLFRSLCNDFIGWHEGDETRFVY